MDHYKKKFPSGNGGRAISWPKLVTVTKFCHRDQNWSRQIFAWPKLVTGKLVRWIRSAIEVVENSCCDKNSYWQMIRYFNEKIFGHGDQFLVTPTLVTKSPPQPKYLRASISDIEIVDKFWSEIFCKRFDQIIRIGISPLSSVFGQELAEKCDRLKSVPFF